MANFRSSDRSTLKMVAADISRDQSPATAVVRGREQSTETWSLPSSRIRDLQSGARNPYCAFAYCADAPGVHYDRTKGPSVSDWLFGRRTVTAIIDRDHDSAKPLLSLNPAMGVDGSLHRIDLVYD